MATYKIVVEVLTKEDARRAFTEVHLIEAKNAAQAIAHAVKSHITCEKATMAEAVELGASGVKLEVAE